LNGFYETWPIAYAEEAYGFAKTGQTMLRVPDGTLPDLYVDGERFEPSQAHLLDFERVVDFTEGTLDRAVSFETPDGKPRRVIPGKPTRVEPCTADRSVGGRAGANRS